MRIQLISDITLAPFKREILANAKEWIVEEVFVEHLETCFLSNTILDNVDYIFIHIDNYFKKRPLKDIEKLLLLVDSFAKLQSRPVILSAIVTPPFLASTLKTDAGFFTNGTLQLAGTLAALQQNSNVFFFDFLSILCKAGFDNAYNFQLGHLYQMPYNKVVIREFGVQLTNMVKILAGQDKKVIVLDCDNTLWGGILGEDGIDGIQCDLNYEGIQYYHFQQFLLQKKSEGFLLALCSKNNKADVQQAFLKKPMPLKWDDFTCAAINWTDKAENLKQIAVDLNVGVNSFIFIDDSEFEVNSIRQLLPGISVLHIVKGYPELLQLLQHPAFRRKTFTAEDNRKSEQYREEAARKDLKVQAGSMEEYISSLGIQLDIAENNLEDLERLAQLTEKTNQFNFNKRGYTARELEHGIKTNQHLLFSLKVTDRFGDYGTVGLIIVDTTEEDLVLENFIMSCRALGRRIEDDFIKEVEQRLVARYGKNFSSIRFVPTEKNVPAATFLNNYTVKQ